MRDASQLAAELLAWFDREARDMPWRRTRDPYAIWLSEVMLQQTRVDTVTPYFERFLDRWPTVQALAAADLDEVLQAWSGLGYYRRARMLHLAAREVVDRHGGAFPSDVAGLRALSGVGAYTAGAVASIAFDVPTPLVDGNVIRVLSRLFGLDDDMRSAGGVARVWSLATTLVPRARPGAFNQALMELGSQVCTPRAPSCGTCPLRGRCEALASDRAEALPRLGPKKPPRAEGLAAAVLVRDETVLLGRRRVEGLFGGMWEPPLARDLDGAIEALAGSGFAPKGPLRSRGTVRHVLSHRRLAIEVFACVEEGEARAGSSWRGRGTTTEAKVGATRPSGRLPDGAFDDRYERLAWRSPDEVALSTLARKVLALGGVALAALLACLPAVARADDGDGAAVPPASAANAAEAAAGERAASADVGGAELGLESGDLERYRALSTTSGSYARVYTSLAGGRGLRFNNPYRLRTQLGADAESLSLTAPYLDVGLGLGFGDPHGWQHGPAFHAAFALEGVSQAALSASYQLLRRGGSAWLGYGRAGVSLLSAPDANLGGEVAGGLARFFTGALGVTGEVVGNLFYGAGTYEKRYTVVPVLSFQLGLIVDLEVLP